MRAQVLIVDDNISNLQLAVKTLIDEKINIFTATSGKDAIETIKNNHIDLLLLDIKMPDMDGFETLEQLRLLPQHDDLPVIFLTSYNDKDILKKCFQEGAVDFIAKPFCSEELLSRVRTHITLSIQSKYLQESNVEKNIKLEQTIIQLQESQRTKEKFLSMMSHELRTPLNGILGMSQVLKYTEQSEENQQFLDDLEVSAKRLNRLLSDILNFVDIDKTSDKAHQVNVKTTQFINHLEYVLFQCNPANSPFKIQQSDNLPAFLTFDQTAVSKITEIFLNNAFKFSKNQQVTLSLQFTPLPKKSGSLEIAVQDKGIGIDPTFQQKIFDKFYQIDSGDKRSYEGSGIGLTLAKKLSQSINGDITLQSSLGQGSTFRLNFPVVIPDETLNKRTADLAWATILVVEDVKTNQAYLGRILKHKNCHTLFASTAEECMEIIQKEKIDFIFMDYLLRKTKGTQLTEQIRLIPEHSLTPIVAVSAQADTETQHECLRAGMNEFISKPFSKNEIFSCLKHYFIVSEENDV